jgi:hypothetical protein
MMSQETGSDHMSRLMRAVSFSREKPTKLFAAFSWLLLTFFLPAIPFLFDWFLFCYQQWTLISYICFILADFECISNGRHPMKSAAERNLIGKVLL